MPVFLYMSESNYSLRHGRLLLVILLVVLYVWSGECVDLCGVNPVFYYNLFRFLNFLNISFLILPKTCFYHFVFVFFCNKKRHLKRSLRR